MTMQDNPTYTPSRPAGSPSTQELIHRDGRPVPPIFELECGRFLGDQDIPFERYTSQAIFDAEMELLWKRTWQWACREEHLAESGDYYVYEIGPHSVLILRGDDGGIHAFVNSCLHRGTKLKPGHSSGSCAEIRCPFHGWRWTLAGELAHIPYAWDVPDLSGRDFSLPRVQVATWAGFVFINLDEGAPPLAEYMAPIPGHLDRFDIGNRHVSLHIEKELNCNWKAAKEAFIENYHTQETHPQLLFGSNDEGTQYDVLSENVSRFYCAFGVPSPLIQPPPTEQEMVDAMLVGDRQALGNQVVVQPGESARIVMARVLRKVLSDATGRDFSGFTDTEMIDVFQYTLIPNIILFPALSLPMAYRFRPLGEDPNRSLFEIMFLRPAPAEGPWPDPTQPFRLKEEDSFTTVPGLDPLLGEVYDQDTGNLRAQQEGFRAARKRGETLLNYQEVRIRHLHLAVQRYLGDAIP